MYEIGVDMAARGVGNYSGSYFFCAAIGKWRICGDFHCPEALREHCRLLYTVNHTSLDQLPQYLTHYDVIIRQAATTRLEELQEEET